jgi:hypothetical protein
VNSHLAHAQVNRKAPASSKVAANRLLFTVQVKRQYISEVEYGTHRIEYTEFYRIYFIYLNNLGLVTKNMFNPGIDVEGVEMNDDPWNTALGEETNPQQQIGTPQ